MHAHESEKATRYITQLEDARCHGRWSDVPELARKVEKHAPSRKNLTITARAEAEIDAFINKRPSSSSSNTASVSVLSNLIPGLLVVEESVQGQERIQASTCLAWLYWALDEPGSAVLHVPTDLAAAVAELSNSGSPISPWTQVCIAKAAYLQGFSIEKTSASSPHARNAYSSVIPLIQSTQWSSAANPQFRQWTEMLLSRLCLLSDLSAPGTVDINIDQALAAFRSWARFYESRGTPSVPSESGKARRLVWKAYYDTLSTILQQDLDFHPVQSSQHDDFHEKNATELDSNTRLQQRAELKKVETIYENLLLNDTKFPKATDSTGEMEFWVEAVISNWRVLCSSSWHDEELGEGGKGSVSRGVLDILYRAATKTYHSTQILRYLFTVHASLAEFDLAFEAFSTYVDIITRGKDRAEKSGEEDLGLDDDDTALRTAAEAIRLLCRFGHRDEAEKAKKIADVIGHWVHPSRNTTNAEIGHIEHKVLPETLAISYRALGMSQANWARFTFDAQSRTKIQAQAVDYFRKALSPELRSSNSIESLYCLGLVLAEMRDITGAIKVVKQALSPSSHYGSQASFGGDPSQLAYEPRFIRERKLIPLWHLLALLLTARSDYNTAVKSCEAAFEQFGDESILFGSMDQTKPYQSERLNELMKMGVTPGLVDEMEAFEREGVVQVKMTRLALMELVDGPGAAVEHSDELLALYARLFGEPNAADVKAQSTTISMPPPKSAVGTTKGSILGRHHTTKKGLERKLSRRRGSSVASHPSSIATKATNAPTIQVTDEDAAGTTDGHHTSLPHADQPEEGMRRRSGSVKLQKKSVGSLRRKYGASNAAPYADAHERNIDGDQSNNQIRNGSVSTLPSDQGGFTTNQSESGPSQPLRPISHNIPHSAQPPPAGHSDQPPQQDVRLPAPLPRANVAPSSSSDPRLPLLQEKCHKISLLVNVWLCISGMYSRAGMYDDATEAVEEASKLVKRLQAESALESCGVKAFATRSWGGGKSVEELWGDIWAARGELRQVLGEPHAALANFETSLQHYPDHPAAIIGLSNILLDIYKSITPPEALDLAGTERVTKLSLTGTTSSKLEHESGLQVPETESPPTPEELHRLAARDRAYSLLSSVTKYGYGWDNCEAWFALSKAYEESGEVEKAKEVLWWCVELEDTRPIRGWSHVGVGGFVL